MPRKTSTKSKSTRPVHVHGHFRTINSGKRVFVKPQVRKVQK